jgi:hypothetical protein
LKTVDTGHSIPGRLVVRDTDDSHVTIAGNDAVNVIGYIAPTPSHDSTVDFATENELRIEFGSGVIVPLTLATGQTIVKGDLLGPAAHGMVKDAGADPDSDKITGQAEESVTTSTLATAPILVRMRI